MTLCRGGEGMDDEGRISGLIAAFGREKVPFGVCVLVCADDELVSWAKQHLGDITVGGLGCILV